MSSPDRITALDSSPAFAAYARRRVNDARVAFVVADARALPLDRECASAIVSALLINFIVQPELALFEMGRVARSGATVAAYVWDYADGMQMLRIFWDAVVELDPAADAIDEGRRFPLCRPHALEALWRTAGLHDVETTPLEVSMRFRDFSDFWQPFLGGQGPAPGYVASLDNTGRERLRAKVMDLLPIASDGSITLGGRAWGVRGRRG